MFHSKTFLAFIGARGGSKGLKNKNIIGFAGKPLIHWTIQAALKSRYIDRTIVSTDSQRIANVARQGGAEVPFLRPGTLARDTSPIEEALRHCLVWFEKNEQVRFDYLVLLQPTSPLRTAKHIDAAIQFYWENRKSCEDTLASVTLAPSKMGWLMASQAKGYVDFCFNSSRSKARRQDVPQFFLPNGAIYIAPAALIKKRVRNVFYRGRTLPFVMAPEVSVDIDSRHDLDEAKKLKKGQKNPNL